MRAFLLLINSMCLIRYCHGFIPKTRANNFTMAFWALINACQSHRIFRFLRYFIVHEINIRVLMPATLTHPIHNYMHIIHTHCWSFLLSSPSQFIRYKSSLNQVVPVSHRDFLFPHTMPIHAVFLITIGSIVMQYISSYERGITRI